MTQQLNIIIRQTNVTPAANVTFRYASEVTTAAEVDTDGEYAAGVNVMYVALVDSDGTPMPNLPIGTVLTMNTRNPLNTPITVERTITSFTANPNYITIGLSGTVAENHNVLDFTAAVPGSSNTRRFWARRSDFSLAYLAVQDGLNPVNYSDTTYRVRPDDAWTLGATFIDETGTERTVYTISQDEDGTYWELLAGRVSA